MPQNTEAVAKEVARVNPEVGNTYCAQEYICIGTKIYWYNSILVQCIGKVFVKELFAELDEEGDGIVYTKNLIIQLRALNEDMDKNLKVRCITYLVLTYHTVSKECSTRTWT